MNLPTLRFMTCGSAGDGKSTLIERLLRDTHGVSEDQVKALEAEVKPQAERGGVTVEVACRCFATARRRFVVADTPGHEQYARNTATAASGADLAVVLVDVRKGVQQQTRRHTRIAAMMGIRHVLLAVNKMDLVDYDEATFEGIVEKYREFASGCGLPDVEAIPICALDGDNVAARSTRMPWHDGPPLLGYLETAKLPEHAAPAEPPPVADQFEARLVWMGEHALAPGRPYLLRLHAKEVSATVTEIKYREDVDSGAHLAAKSLAMNDIAVVNLSTSQPVAFEPYSVNRALGGFVLVDKLTLETVAAGVIEFALRRSANIHWQALDIDKAARATAKHQSPRCIWFTGLSASGKSTIANLLEKRLHAAGRHTYLLDGDNVRHGLNRDLGFTEADRVENIRRVAEVARLMVDAGLVVIVSFISPYRAERRMAREFFAPGEFVEVFVDAPLEVCEKRDPKGLYAKARRGELKNFTGIDSEYEAPESPEVHLATDRLEANDSVERVMEWLNALKS